MKSLICTLLYAAVSMASCFIFAINGFGVDTWQWWAQLLGMWIAHFIGSLRAVDFE